MHRDIDGDLSETEYQAMTKHLQHCSSCAGLYDKLQRLSSELSLLPKVLPSYSLVDAILPRLEQIHAEQHLQSQSSAEEPKKQLRWNRWIWPLSGGAAAAGLFIAFLMSGTTLHGIFPQNAGRNSSASYFQFSKNIAHSQESGSQQLKKRDDAYGNAVTQQNDSSKGSSASTAPNKTFNAAAEIPMPSGKPAAPMLTMNNSVDAMQPDSKASGDTSSSPIMPEAAAKNPIQAAHKAGIAPNPAPSPAPNPAPSPAPNPAPSPAPSPAGDMHPMLIAPTQTVASSVYAVQLMPVLSPDQVYSALLINQHVTIKQGDITIFVSKTNLLPSDSVTSMKWRSSAVFTYEVLSQGSTRTYQIDLQAKTETEIPSK